MQDDTWITEILNDLYLRLFPLCKGYWVEAFFIEDAAQNALTREWKIAVNFGGCLRKIAAHSAHVNIQVAHAMIEQEEK